MKTGCNGWVFYELKWDGHLLHPFKSVANDCTCLGVPNHDLTLSIDIMQPLERGRAPLLKANCCEGAEGAAIAKAQRRIMSNGELHINCI